jgi:hypothetical protein
VPGDAWAERVMDHCRELAEAGMMLAHGETGFMRLLDDGSAFDAWIASRQAPATWRMREDIDWWAGRLADRHRAGLDAAASRGDAHAVAAAHLGMMAYQFPYPPDAVIGGLPAAQWLAVLGHLIVRAVQADPRDAAILVPSAALERDVARALDMDAVTAAGAIAAFTLAGDNAAWHAATPGGPIAPLVRVSGEHLVLCRPGLTTEPLFFLTGELRRRDPEGYHNAAHLREVAFRRDLNALFADRRFVTSDAGLRLRHAAGSLRTDIDAAIFDRKTGTLGLFELKSQDVLARSAAALARQRDNLLYANRQVAGALDWIRRNGADDLVKRLDPRIAKTSRAHKVYPFVLSRYLAPAGDGTPPDPRAAWATWPALLRLLEATPIAARDANPIASLHARLSKAAAPALPPAPGRELVLGEARIRVHPSWAAFQGHNEGAT